MDKRTHCQSCGAPIELHAEKCAYCGTPYLSGHTSPGFGCSAQEFTQSVTDLLGVMTPNEVRKVLGLEEVIP